MKKTILALCFLLILCFSISFSVNAGDVGEIKVKDSMGNTVSTYEIVINDLNENARTPIQRALDYCRDNATASNIHTVIIPKGTYCLQSSLDLYSNTIVDLSFSVLTRNEDCSAIIRFGRGSDISYGYDGYKNITVKNGTIDARDIGNTSLVRFAHAYNVEFSNVVFKNTTDVSHMLTFAACKNVRILDCQFLDMEIVNKSGSLNCEAIQIDILKKKYFEYPEYDGTTTKNVVVSGCTFSNVPRGVGTHSGIAGHYFDSIKIADNIFKNLEGYAIRALNYTNSEISGNTIIDCGSGINCATVSNYSLINFYAPLKISDEIIRDMNVKIFDNTISLKSHGEDTIAFGIKVEGANIENHRDEDGKTFSADCRIGGVTVENNTITTRVDDENIYAIHLVGALGSAYGDKTDVVVKNNSVTFTNPVKSTNTNYGIKLETSSNIYVYNNTLTDKRTSKMNLHSGIFINDCENITVSKNKVSNTNAFGIKLTNVTKANIKSNTFNNTTSNGIYVFEGSSFVTVASNAIKNSSGYGISVRDAKSSSIKSNKIYNSRQAGIYITGKGKCTTISSNYICDSGSTGVYLNQNASATTISKNRIDITSKNIDAITINDKATVSKIEENKINTKTDSASKKLTVKCKHGIRINSSACKISEISDNVIKECANNGIAMFKSKTKATIEGNEIRNANSGIAVNGANVNSIKSNKIYNIKQCSIYITGKSACKTISSNYICDSGSNAIYFNQNASATIITKNRIDIDSGLIDAIVLNDKSTVSKITYNKINTQSEKEGKKLKVKCRYGIRINSAKCKIKEITGNTVNKCDKSGIYIAKMNGKVKITKNKITDAAYGITYIKGKATLKGNTVKKCTVAKTRVL